MIETNPTATVYELNLPEGRHYVPKYITKVRNDDNAARDKGANFHTRLVRCHPMGFEGDGAGKRKYLAPILWAYPQGDLIVCAVAIESPQGTQIARAFLTPQQYYASPVAELNSL